MSPLDDDVVDRAALERLWPIMKYADPWRFSWFRYVGRTRQQREGLRAARVHGGPRGLIYSTSGRIHTRSTFSGEFDSK